MLVIQTSQAKRLRKHAILMVVVMLITGAMGGILTMHWFSLPPKK